ncbi:hypothetical protein [Syntrophomonas palmitatica]|uniref:hypothetical protein n=1 Tax=Syntrophomonas palmitatica TaxID=402877 RepID=UPI0006D12BC5|nr:hypothetical protein [Syntrophomonas palmitatica]
MPTATVVSLTPANPSANYRVSADAGQNTRAYYRIFDQNFLNNYEYVDTGYYGSGGTMVNDYASAQVFTAGNTDLTGINLTFIPGGPWVKGTISLPSGQTATQDLTIGVGALYPSNPVVVLKSQDVVIPSGSSSASYAMRLQNGQSYKLGYNIYNGDYCKNQGYLQSGLFKSVSETVYSAACATNITADGVTGFANANMTVLTGGRSVQGTVTLPSGLSGDNRLIVKAINMGGGNEWSLTSLVVPAGTTSMPYTLVVPDGSYTLEARLYNGSGEVTYSSAYVGFGSVVSICVTDNVTGADITVNPISPGPSSPGGDPIISPSCVGAHSVLIDNVAVNVNSSYYSSDFFIHFGHYGYLYYKDANSAWYNLMTQTAGSPANPVSESSLPLIGYYYN